MAAAAAAAAAMVGVQAAAAASDAPQALPLRVEIGAERLRLPGGEPLGLAGGRLLFQVAPGWWLGPALFGAVSGQRGGLFVMGGEVQRRWVPAPVTLPGLDLVAALSAGGGGGASAAVGDGLMLRVALGVAQDLGPLRAGLSWSTLRFAGSPIASRQRGLTLAWRSEFLAWAPSLTGQTVAAPRRSGVGADRFALTVSRQRLRGRGAPLDLGTAGARALQSLDALPGAYWGLEAAGALQRANAGYMEVAALVGRDWSMGDGLRSGLRLVAGAGGGGTVPAGGGTMARLDGTLAWAIAPGWDIGAELGAVRGRSAGRHGQRTGVWLSADLEPAGEPGSSGREGTVHGTAWTPTWQWHSGIARHDGTRAAMQTVGLSLEHWWLPNVYLTGQAHSAMAGQAGAWSTGLAGIGWAPTPDAFGWRWGAEALVGGAGGGGVQGLSGLVGQALAWTAYTSAGRDAALRLGLGLAGPLRGGGARDWRPVVGLGWSVAFGQPGR